MGCHEKFCYIRTCDSRKYYYGVVIRKHTHTHTHTFNGPFSGTTQVSRYQKDKTNLDFTEARDSEWQWQQLGHMQVCTSLQTDDHASTPPLSFFTGRMPFLPPNQQRQSTEGTTTTFHRVCIIKYYDMVKMWSRFAQKMRQELVIMSRRPENEFQWLNQYKMYNCGSTSWKCYISTIWITKAKNFGTRNRESLLSSCKCFSRFVKMG